jgi:hypothetical protein
MMPRPSSILLVDRSVDEREMYAEYLEFQQATGHPLRRMPCHYVFSSPTITT